jgi:hypothetical protein
MKKYTILLYVNKFGSKLFLDVMTKLGHRLRSPVEAHFLPCATVMNQISKLHLVIF